MIKENQLIAIMDIVHKFLHITIFQSEATP